MPTRIRFPTLCALCLAAAAAQAGTALETVNRNLAGGERTTTISTWAQDGKMRVETKPGTSVMIFKDDTIYALNGQDKTYHVMDRATMQRMAAQLNPALKQLQEQMAQMPPEQRAQMEKMLGNRMPGMGPQKTRETRRTSRNDKIGGYSCTYVEVLEDGTLADEMCVVAPGAIKGSQELMAAAKKMGALMQEMMAGLDAPWLRQLAEREAMDFEKLGGIPVLSRHFMDGKPASETTLQSIRTEAVAATMFDVPAGYTKKDMLSGR